VPAIEPHKSPMCIQHLELVRPQTDPAAWPAGVNTYLRETVDMYVDTPPTAKPRARFADRVLLPQCILYGNRPLICGQRFPSRHGRWY